MNTLLKKFEVLSAAVLMGTMAFCVELDSFVPNGEGAISLTSAQVYNGYLYSAWANTNSMSAADLKGTIQVKVSKGRLGKNARTLVSNLKVTIQEFGRKKISLRGEVDSQNGRVKLEAKDGRILRLAFGSKGMMGTFDFGNYDGYEIDGARDLFSSKVGAERSAAEEVLEQVKGGGSIGLVWENEGGMGLNGLSISVGEKGKARVTGQLADGIKVSTSAQMIIGEEWCVIPVVYSKRLIELAFSVWIARGGDEVKVVGLCESLQKDVIWVGLGNKIGATITRQAVGSNGFQLYNYTDGCGNVMLREGDLWGDSFETEDVDGCIKTWIRIGEGVMEEVLVERKFGFSNVVWMVEKPRLGANGFQLYNYTDGCGNVMLREGDLWGDSFETEDVDGCIKTWIRIGEGVMEAVPKEEGGAFSGEEAVVGRAANFEEGAAFTLDSAALLELMGDGVYEKYLPEGVAITVNGSKWVLPKAGKVSMKKGGIDESKAGSNPAGLKLSYKAKDGSFSGSFKVYANVNGKLKATSVSVSGFVVNGKGYGTATIKKVGSVPIMIE